MLVFLQRAQVDYTSQKVKKVQEVTLTLRKRENVRGVIILVAVSNRAECSVQVGYAFYMLSSGSFLV